MATRRGPDLSVRVAIAGAQTPSSWANVFWAQLATGSAIIQADLDAWLTSFSNAYKTAFAPRQNANVAYQTATATLFLPGLSVLRSSVAMSGAGTEAGTAIVDASAAKVVSWLSTVYWRGGKPRTYITGAVTADMATIETLTATELAALKTAAGTFRTTVNALVQGTITSTVLGFVSFRSGNVDRVPPLFFPVTGATTHPRLGSQRRRLGAWKP